MLPEWKTAANRWNVTTDSMQVFGFFGFGFVILVLDFLWGLVCCFFFGAGAYLFTWGSYHTSICLWQPIPMHTVIIPHLDTGWQNLCMVHIDTIPCFQGLILDMVNWKHGSLYSSYFGCQSPPYISLLQSLPPPSLNLITACSLKGKSHGTTTCSYLIYAAVHLFLKQYISLGSLGLHDMRSQWHDL